MASVEVPAVSPPEPEPQPDRLDRIRPLGILALAGASLTLVQYVAMKEFASLIGSNELVLLLVLTAYFLGLSLGYLVSDRIGSRALGVIGLATLALQFTLPFSARWVTGTLSRINLGGNTPPFVFLLVLFGVTPFYAVFLPRLVDGARARAPLGLLYATEIGGAVAGLAVVVLLTPARMRAILTVHLAALVALLVLYAGARRWRWLAPLALLPLAYAVVYPALDAGSLAYAYRWVHDLRRPVVVASEFSSYQRVDLIESGSSDKRALQLYLNGNLLYGTSALHEHNLLVSILPNLVAGRPTNAVVIGGGSLDSARYLAPRVKRLHVVEIDEAVVRLARRHIQEPRGGFPDGWDLAIDDGKHFLGTWQGPAFDVISIDVPVPTHLQTAMLHSERFFALAHDRLAPDGLFSIALSGRLTKFDPDDDEFLTTNLGNRIVAGLLRHFAHVTVVKGERRDFAWASDAPFPLTRDQLVARLREFLAAPDARAFGNATVELIDEATVRQWAEGAEPIGEADMQVVLRMSVSKLYYRYYDPDE